MFILLQWKTICSPNPLNTAEYHLWKSFPWGFFFLSYCKYLHLLSNGMLNGSINAGILFEIKGHQNCGQNKLSDLQYFTNAAFPLFMLRTFFSLFESNCLIHCMGGHGFPENGYSMYSEWITQCHAVCTSSMCILWFLHSAIHSSIILSECDL